MKVRIIKTGEERTVNNSYGLRLIEQGKAITCHAAPKSKKEAAAKPSEAK